jgi:60 kDa SS-A/Ro ribonucleoprotein
MKHRSVDTLIYRPATGGPQPEPQMTVGLAQQWTYTASPQDQLIRGLTTNTLTDTFYATKQALAQELVALCLDLAKTDPAFLAKAAVWASTEGRALNNTAPNVALAALAAVKMPEAMNWYAKAFDPIVRTPLHLLEHVELLRKGNLGRKSLGRSPRTLIRAYLNRLNPYNAVKYHARANLRDLLRLTHPTPATPEQEGIFGWLVKGKHAAAREISAYMDLQEAKDDTTRIKAIEEGNLAWEAALPLIPQPSFAIWTALLKQMPYMAMLRHLSAVSRHGVLPDELIGYLVERLTDTDAITQAKILPFQINAALGIYAAGGMGGRARGILSRGLEATPAFFMPDARIVEALDRALELSFANWALPGRVVILTDVSGSMRQGGVNEGKISSYLDVAAIFTAAAVQATDGQAHVVAFNDHAFEVPLPSRRFAEVVRSIHATPSGGTNMAAGFEYLASHRIPADLVIGITDNESWAGRLTVDALREYRDQQRPRAIILLTIAPYQDSVSPMNEPSVFQVAGWSPAIGQFMQMVAAENANQLQYIDAIEL